MPFWKNKPLIIALVLFIVLLVLLFTTSGTNPDSMSIVGGWIAPIQETMYNITASVGGFFERLFGTPATEEEVMLLREKLADMESRVREYDYVLSENERLKNLLNVKETYGEYNIVTARVIGKNPGEWFNTFTINVGREDGIQKDMIVMTDKGLLGRVLSSSSTYSKVISLVDVESGVPSMVERTRDVGVVKPSGRPGDDRLEMTYVTANSDIVPGDKVITSGIGGLFPKGMYVGTVIEVGADENYQTRIFVKSEVDFEHVEEVVVIKYLFEELESP